MKLSLFLSLAVVMGGISAQAATYYVATNGSDSNPGTLQNPWRNIDYAAGQVAPGDTVLVRGGIYYEKVTSRVSGTSTQRITFKAYPNETPIIDGTVAISGWTKCSSEKDFLRPDGTSIGSFAGNPNYAKIYKTTVTESEVGNPSMMSIYENGEYMFKSSMPAQSNNVFDDERTYKPVDPSCYGQTAYMIDPDLTQPTGFWDGSTVRVWVLGNNNQVSSRTVASFNGSQNKITFSSSLPANLSNNGTSPDAYALQNHWSLLNKPGTVYYTTNPVDGKYTIYVWPLSTSSLDNNIRVSVRDVGFWLSSASYVTIDGFTIRGCAEKPSSQAWRNGGIVNGVGFKHTGLHIRNCKVQNNACDTGIGIWCGTSDIIENNVVENCRTGFGIALQGRDYARVYDSIVRNNTLSQIYSTGFKIIYSTNTQITGNTASKFGNHANGCSLYQFNDKVLFAHNRIVNARNALTLKESSDVTVYNNVLHGSGSTAQGAFILAAWAAGSGVPMSGTVAIINNTILSEFGSQSLYISNSPATQANWIVKNNKIDGFGLDSGITPDLANNLYVDLFWKQEQSSYTFGPGEFYSSDMDAIFTDYDAMNYTHAKDGLGLDKGTSIAAYLPRAQFPDYNFDVDMAGKPRIAGAKIDIGAYEGAGEPVVVEDPPVANAGTDQTVDYEDRQSIQLDASQSTGYGTLTYEWSYNGSVVATGQKPAVSFSSAGTYQILLTVTDGQATPATDTDTVSITVSEEVVVVPPDDPDYSSLRNGLVGEWMFTDSTGTVAQDTSGSSNNATVTSESMWDDEGCLDFSSTETYASCAPNQALDLSGSLSISAWINPRSFGQSNYGRILDKGVGSASRGFSLLINGNSGDVGYLTYGGAYVSSDNDVINLNTWTHVCATYDQQAQTVSFYINGQPAGSAAYTQAPASTPNDPLYIGLRGYDANRNFDGLIDGVKLYARSVSDAEALMLYESGRGGDLVGNWKLDDFTGTDAADSSEYKNTATLMNNPQWGRSWAQEEYLSFKGGHEALQIPTYGWNKKEGTISMWVQPESSDYFQFLFGHVLNSANRIFLYTNGGKLAIGLGNSSALATNVATLLPGQTYHIALVWKDTDYSLCLDGVEVAAGTFSGFTGFNTFADVCNYGEPTIRDSYSLSWDGFVDDISIYRRALQDEEIHRLCYTHEVKAYRNLEFAIDGSVNYYPSQLPDGATFDAATQTFSWRPWYDQTGEHVILFIAEDGSGRETITVNVEQKPLDKWYEDFLKFKGKL